MVPSTGWKASRSLGGRSPIGWSDWLSLIWGWSIGPAASMPMPTHCPGNLQRTLTSTQSDGPCKDQCRPAWETAERPGSEQGHHLERSHRRPPSCRWPSRQQLNPEMTLCPLEVYGAKGGWVVLYMTIAKIRERFYWIGLDRDVEDWCQRCELCAKRKPPRKAGTCSPGDCATWLPPGTCSSRQPWSSTESNSSN